VSWTRRNDFTIYSGLCCRGKMWEWICVSSMIIWTSYILYNSIVSWEAFLSFCVFSEHASSSPMLHKSRRKTSCTVCNAVILKKNLRRHVTRYHEQHADGLVLPSVLVCKRNGIYTCAKNVLGSHYPTHVQLKTSSSVQIVLCKWGLSACCWYRKPQ